MAKIRVDDINAIRTLRELVKSNDLFPYADFSPDDPDVEICITVYKKDPENENLKYASREFNEANDGRLVIPIRNAIFQELWKINPDKELIKRLESLGITIEVPISRSKWF